MLRTTTADIYLDANATTRVLPQAADTAYEAMEGMFGNPSSSHISGLQARSILESARTLASRVLGSDEGSVIFTSGATEAIQTAVFSALCWLRQQRLSAAVPLGDSRYLLYGATEHKAVPEALAHWNHVLGLGDEVVAIPVDQRGHLDLGFLQDHLAAADMVCTMAVNNETGVVHDLPAIEAVLRGTSGEVLWFVDCVQAVGKLDLRLGQTTIDYAAVSGHKIHAPKGVGLLYARRNAPLTPLIAGGGQERGARSGTENLPGVAALGTVFEHLCDPSSTAFNDLDTLDAYRERLIASLESAFPAILFNTPFECAVPNTINFSIKGFSSKEILDLFDAAGVRVSSGSACGSALQGSYVLDAMGFPKWRSEAAIRLSFGLTDTADDIADACRRIAEAGRALRESCLIIADHVPAAEEAQSRGLIQLKKDSNCSWILNDPESRTCVVIEPFEEFAERIESLIRCQDWRVVAILDTHLHVDHQSCRAMLSEVLKDRLLPSARQTDALGWPGEADGSICLADDSEAPLLRWGTADVIARTPLPGHTTDGVAYLVGRPTDPQRIQPDEIRCAFTGDTLLIGGIGRTDFPTSSVSDLLSSLRRLPRILGSNSLICPTHDYTNGFSTTLTAETTHNAFLARILDPVAPMTPAEFEREKGEVDRRIQDDQNCELVCGLIQPYVDHHESVDLLPEELASYFQQHLDARVFDVRESHEHRFRQDWSALGLSDPPENLPLTRLSGFLQSLLCEPSQARDQKMIFVCRSGNRSSRAAEVLRRLGFHNTWHIAGGLALGGGVPTTHAEADELEYVI